MKIIHPGFEVVEKMVFYIPELKTQIIFSILLDN